MPRRDEAYIIGLCDKVLCCRAMRQYRFDFLCGDTGRPLPVDAYYPELKLVVEYRERQHFECVRLWDNRRTVSGIPRGQQRARYDKRRREVLPQRGITLIELAFSDFKHDGRKRLHRIPEQDKQIIREKLASF